MFALRRVTCFRLTDTTTSKLTNRVQQLSSTVSNVSSGSTDAKTEQTKTARCRTNKSDPTNHSPSDEAMFYTLPKEVQNKLFAVYNWHKTTHELFDVMNEAAIMIRRPALQIMQELRSHDWEQPLRRFLLHGRPGTGRSFTLTHLAHFGHKSNYILVHCVSPNAFTRYPQEKATSDYKADRVDTPIDAALLLQHFKAQNAHLLTNLTTSRAYMWTMREKTEQGEPLINVIDHGINRMKHASDAYAVLLKELKLAASANQCRVLMVIDKINLFYWASNIRLIDYRYAEVDNITVARAFKKLFQPDWTNAVLVGAIDKHSRDELEQDFPNDPAAILTEKGQQALSPYELIEMNNYTDKEFVSCLEYYNDRHFLHHPAIFTESGRNESKFITAKNPLDVYKFCKSI